MKNSEKIQESSTIRALETRIFPTQSIQLFIEKKLKREEGSPDD